jgi:hypothetical protein
MFLSQVHFIKLSISHKQNLKMTILSDTSEELITEALGSAYLRRLCEALCSLSVGRMVLDYEFR